LKIPQLIDCTVLTVLGLFKRRYISFIYHLASSVYKFSHLWNYIFSSNNWCLNISLKARTRARPYDKERREI
jgi:hypothetical protein